MIRYHTVMKKQFKEHRSDIQCTLLQEKRKCEGYIERFLRRKHVRLRIGEIARFLLFT